MFAISYHQLVVAACVAGAVAVAAGAARLLTFSGVLAAFAVGVFVFGFGRLAFALPLLAFFLSSSVLSAIGKRRKAPAEAGYAKTSRRDAGQVLANGGVPTVLAILFALSIQEQWAGLMRPSMLLFLGALAAVNADTWATEIGGMFSVRPWHVLTLRKVDPGTSGAISVPGLIASLAGAAFVAFAGWAAWPARTEELLWRIDAPEIIAIVWAGFVAAYVDSLAGASIQAQYRCGRCGRITERRVHCGGSSVLARGWCWVNNDVVNLVASLSGVLFSWILLRVFAYPA